MTQVLDQIVSKLTREDCLRILNDPRLDAAALQRALATVAGTPFVAAAATPAQAPAVNGTPAAAATKPPSPPKPPKAAQAPANGTPAAAAVPAGVKPADAIVAMNGQGLGFAAGDIATVCGLDARDSSIRTAIKNALGAKTVVSFGEKRFMRYGATEAIAQAASLKARGQ